MYCINYLVEPNRELFGCNLDINSSIINGFEIYCLHWLFRTRTYTSIITKHQVSGVFGNARNSDLDCNSFFCLLEYCDIISTFGT